MTRSLRSSSIRAFSAPASVRLPPITQIRYGARSFRRAFGVGKSGSAAVTLSGAGPSGREVTTQAGLPA